MKKQVLTELLFSQGIQNTASDLRTAWLISVTCAIAGLSCFGIIIQGFALEFTWSMVWILIGHSMVTFFPLSFRFFSSMHWPSRIFGILTITQIINAIYQTGGMESEVLYAFAALPILLSFVLGLESLLFNAFLSILGILCIYYLDQIGHVFPNPKSTDFIKLCVILWGVLTSWIVGYYSRYQYVVIQEKLEDELQRRQKIQIALEEQHNNKDRFFAYLSHEIRNPLTSILGTTEAILADVPNGLLKQQMRRLQKSTFHVNELLEQVLDFSSLQADQITLNIEQIDIIEMLENIVEWHKDICMQKKIQIHLLRPRTHCDTKIFIQADYVRLHQVLLNLISNAIKFSDREQAKIYIQVDILSIVSNATELEKKISLLPSYSEQSPAYRSIVQVICRDEGIGIQEEDLERIFMPYKRSQSSQKGAGLGLAICKSLVEAMDGEIFVQSKLQQGTSFYLQFPEFFEQTEDSEMPSLVVIDSMNPSNSDTHSKLMQNTLDHSNLSSE